MATFEENMAEYRRQMHKGAVQAAYRGLMDYMLALKTHFQKRCPESAVSGGLYAGYMDMTYFSIVPPALKARSLKIAVVFLHEDFRFEVWLSGANRPVQVQFSRLLQEGGWDRYPLSPDPKNGDSIVEHVLADPPNFGDLAALTSQIEGGVLAFIRDVEGFLASG